MADVVTNPAAGTIRKLRVSRWWGAALTAAAFAVSFVLRKFGLVGVTPEDVDTLAAVVAGLYDAGRFAFGALTVWYATYRARPGVADGPVDALTGRPVVPADLPPPVTVPTP